MDSHSKKIRYEMHMKYWNHPQNIRREIFAKVLQPVSHTLFTNLIQSDIS